MSKREFMRLGDFDLYNAIFRPSKYEDDPERGYWPVRRKEDGETGITYRDIFFLPVRVEAMKAAGMTEEEMEAKYRAYIASRRM